MIIKIEDSLLVLSQIKQLTDPTYKHLSNQDVFPSILARSVWNWTGFGEMPSSAAGKILSLSTEQESTERHLGKSPSCGNNYFHDFNIYILADHAFIKSYN
jgi:hypothetical protein